MARQHGEEARFFLAGAATEADDLEATRQDEAGGGFEGFVVDVGAIGIGA